MQIPNCGGAQCRSEILTSDFCILTSLFSGQFWVLLTTSGRNVKRVPHAVAAEERSFGMDVPDSEPYSRPVVPPDSDFGILPWASSRRGR
jgi:hypothetical protein